MPSLAAVTPPTGILTGGTALTLTGTNFLAGVTGVELGGRPATDVIVASDTELTCTSPTGAAIGEVAVQVMTNTGAAVLPAGFSYTDPAFAPDPSIFDGTYYYGAVGYSTLAGSGQTIHGLWTSTGTGDFAALFDENRDGVISVGNSSPTNLYSALANGMFSVDFPPFTGPVLEGGIASDGSVAVMAQTVPGSDPLIACAIRRGGSFSNGTLNGTFHYVDFSHDGVNASSSWGTIEFSGAGLINAGSVVRNTNGTIGAPAAVTGAYSVAAQGDLMVSTDICLSSRRGGRFSARSETGPCLAPGAPTRGTAPVGRRDAPARARRNLGVRMANPRRHARDRAARHVHGEHINPPLPCEVVQRHAQKQGNPRQHRLASNS